LPQVFDRLNDDGVYKDLVTIDDDKIAYTMIKLESIPIKKLPWRSTKMFTALLLIIFKKIEEMHSKKNILHCDMKIDNIMFTKTDGIKDLLMLLQTLKTNLKIIDYDGCILLNDDDKASDDPTTEIKKGYTYHPTTPVFAHPFLFEKLYLSPNRADTNLTRFQYIEMMRRALQGDLLDHRKYHLMIFTNFDVVDYFNIENQYIDLSYNKIFPENLSSEQLTKALKFCDYYNMTMSLLMIKKQHEENEKDKREQNDNKIEDDKIEKINNKEFEKIACELLAKEATKLGLKNSRSGGSPNNKSKKQNSKSQAVVKIPDTILKIKNNVPKLNKDEYITFGIGGYIHKEKFPKLEVSNIDQFVDDLTEKEYATLLPTP
jgi:serine/threonine protein kinase